MKKINRIWLTAVVMAAVLVFSLVSMASETVEFDVDNLSVEICVVNAGFSESNELVPNEQGLVDAILMVKNNNGGISEVNYTLTGDGVAEEHHITVSGMGEELLSQQEMADWSVIERADDEISCLAGMVNIPAQKDVSIYLAYSDFDGNSYSDQVSYSIAEVINEPEEECIDEMDDVYSKATDSLEIEEYIDMNTAENTENLAAEEIEADEEVEIPAEDTIVETGIETEEDMLAEETETGTEAEAETDMPAGETETETEAETEADMPAGETETETEAETEADMPVGETETETEAETGTEMSAEDAVVEAEAESYTEPCTEVAPETYPSYSEPVYYPVYIPVSGGSTGSKTAKSYSSNKTTYTASQDKTLEQQFDEKLEAEKLENDQKNHKTVNEKQDEEETKKKDFEPKEEAAEHDEGSIFELEEEQYSGGAYLKTAGSLVIYENNPDKLDEDSIVVTVVRNGETVELERDADYTVVMIGNSANRKKYKYIISSHVFEGDGCYQLYIYSKDVKGNENYSESKGLNILFNVDNTEPLIINSQGECMQDDPLKREVIVRDNMQLSDVSIFLGDKKLDYEQEGETYRFTVPEEETEAELKIVAADIAGNEVERNITPTVYAGSKGLRPQKSSMPLGILILIIPVGVLSGIIIRKRNSRKQKTVVLR